METLQWIIKLIIVIEVLEIGWRHYDGGDMGTQVVVEEQDNRDSVMVQCGYNGFIWGYGDGGGGGIFEYSVGGGVYVISMGLIVEARVNGDSGVAHQGW